MSLLPQDYTERVIADVKKYNGIRKTKKAGLIERCATKYCNPEKLHPNPYDEFSDESIGPNFEIIGRYVEEIKFNLKHNIQIFEEPVIVQKMEPDGYLLVNGHHRWFAALRMGLPKLHIQIVNLVGEEDVKRMIDRTENVLIAVFDLDEVLISADEKDQAPITDTMFSRKFKERLRTGAPDLIRHLQEKGYDVWVYSKGYLTEEEVQDFFSMYDITVDGMINGFSKKPRNPQAKDRIENLLRSKYHQSVYIDNEAVLSDDRLTGEYEFHDLKDPAGAWAGSAMEIIDAL